MKTREFLILLTVAVLSATFFTALAIWAIDDEFRQQDAVIEAAKEKSKNE